MASSNAWYWWAIALAVLVGLGLFGGFGGERDAALRRDGQAARGEVLSVRQTGQWSNNNPEVELLIRIGAQGAPPYQATLLAVVPQVNLAAVQPGMTLRLRIDRDNAQRIALDEDWAR